MSAMRHMADAQTATRLAQEGMNEFMAALNRGDWESAEKARVKVVAAQEAALDHIFAAHRENSRWRQNS